MIPSQLPLFIAVSQEGSFSAASRKLGISAAAVSKGIAVLEKQTGVRLFHRNTRQFSLTEDGATLFNQISPLLSEIEHNIDAISEQSKNPSGKIRINLPDGFGRELIMPHIPEFLKLYPDIQLDLVFEDRVLDIIDEGFDIGIGNRINEDSRLIARQLYSMQTGIFTSKDYAEKFGVPTSIDQLSEHNCIAYKPLSSGRNFSWPLKDGAQDHRQYTPKGNLSISNISAAKIALQQNLGLAYMGEWHIAKELEQGEFVPVLKSLWIAPQPVWIYYSSRKNLPRRIRLFIDFILDKLST